MEINQSKIEKMKLNIYFIDDNKEIYLLKNFNQK